MIRSLGCFALLLTCATNLLAAEPSPADAEFFEKRIRPVLIEHCQDCHGEKKQKGGLRLDSYAALMSGGDLGAAVIPGDIAKSLLLEAVMYENEKLQMPPKKRLSTAVINDLTEWVKRGAPWPGGGSVSERKPTEMVFTKEQLAHWAFQPLKKPSVPQPKNSAWAKTDIDRFIMARLEESGLSPAKPAPPATLLRRITYDLTGLPPTSEDVMAFEKAGAGNLPEVITRLLGSPHHGEHFARHWLDVARYADSNGSEVDHAMANAWRYRDYIVRSFNEDKPYDQFVREQVAGDLLPGHNAETLTATGFLMLGPKALADLDKPKLAADIVDEQVDTLCRAFIGMTMGCSRCHDHKFDPLPTADYYAMAGIFSSTRTMVDINKRVGAWTERPVGPPEDAKRIEELLARIALLQKQRDATGTGTKVKPKLAADKTYLVIEAEDFVRGNVRVESDQLGKGIGVVRTRMEYPDHIEYEFELPAAGMYQIELRYAAKESRPVELSLNGNLEDMNAAAEVTGDWRPANQQWFTQGRYQFRAGKNTLSFHRDGPVPLFDKILIGKVSDEPHARNVASAPAAKPSGDAQAINAGKRKLDAAIAQAQKDLETIHTVMAPMEGKVADAPILVRGSPSLPGAVVARGFPRIVPALSEVKNPGAEQSGRLELAHWLTHPQHPLTARVIVNRVWLWHFGEGLVRSPDNFGLRGEAPSHPEMLDWLAIWFVENGWSLKKLHTLICSSAVYQQASSNPSLDVTKDPENRLLSRFPVRRLRAEELRDSMLAVSGQLDRALGGSVMTVMNRTYAAGGNAPGDIVKQMNYDTLRRSLYLPVIRSSLNDFLAAFDYPDPGMLTGQRSQTTVAPQALFVMNSPFVKMQAAAFSRRLQGVVQDDAARVQTAYLEAFSRKPSDAETKSALAFLDRDEAELKAAGDKAPRSTAWTRLCHALLAANDFLYVR